MMTSGRVAARRCSVATEASSAAPVVGRRRERDGPVLEAVVDREATAELGLPGGDGRLPGRRVADPDRGRDRPRVGDRLPVHERCRAGGLEAEHPWQRPGLDEALCVRRHIPRVADRNAERIELADRFAEAAAEHFHERVRRELWGYAAAEALTDEQLVRERLAQLSAEPIGGTPQAKRAWPSRFSGSPPVAGSHLAPANKAFTGEVRML